MSSQVFSIAVGDEVMKNTDTRFYAAIKSICIYYCIHDLSVDYVSQAPLQTLVFWNEFGMNVS